MADTKFGTFEELMQATEPPMQPICERLREVVFELDPDAVEVVRLGDRAATYGLGPQKMKEGYAYILPYAGWVNLGFFKGADLPDPNGLMEGTGAKMRHVKIRRLEEAENEALRDLLRAARAERAEALWKK